MLFRSVQTSTEMGRQLLIQRGAPPEKIRLIRRGLESFPNCKPLRNPRHELRLISIAVVCVSLFMMGGSGVAALWQKQIDEKQAEVLAAQKLAAKANGKIKYVIVQKIKVIHDKQVIVHNDIKRDAAEIDASCKVSPKAIKDLNEATE